MNETIPAVDRSTRAELREEATQRERRRVVGVILAEVGTWQLSGDLRVAGILDRLALRVEHPELEA